MKAVGFNKFVKLNESEEERFTGNINADKKTAGEEEKEKVMFDEEHPGRMELVKLFKNLINDIEKANPKTLEEYEKIKEDVSRRKNEIMNHPKYKELKKEGFPWQDSTLLMEDILADLKATLNKFQKRISGKF